MDLAKITAELIAVGDDEGAVTRLLRRRCPSIVRQLERDAARPGLLRSWGRSANVDENTGTTIVPVTILRAVLDLAGLAWHDEHVHAGVMHTYGYLFSPIETPYGLKRDRWVEGQVERALGLPRRSLVPQPRSGTLLANLTYALGRIAFRGRRREIDTLRRFRDDVPDAGAFAYRKLRGVRTTETFCPARNRVVRLHTDLVRTAPRSPHGALLLLWIEDTLDRTGSLITAFPIAGASLPEVLPGDVEQRAEIRLRYNARIPGLATGPFQGIREVRTFGPRLPPGRDAAPGA